MVVLAIIVISILILCGIVGMYACDHEYGKGKYVKDYHWWGHRDLIQHTCAKCNHTITCDTVYWDMYTFKEGYDTYIGPYKKWIWKRRITYEERKVLEKLR